MKPLFIDCSPRVGGNSDYILGAIKHYYDVDSVILRDLEYEPCNGCDCCKELSRCIHEDDASRLYDDIEKRKDIFLIAPVYFYNFDAHTKAFIDRAQYMWSRIRAKHSIKKVHLLAIGGQNFENNFVPMEKTVACFALTIGAKYAGGVTIGGIDKKEDIKVGHGLVKMLTYVHDVLVERYNYDK